MLTMVRDNHEDYGDHEDHDDHDNHDDHDDHHDHDDHDDHDCWWFFLRTLTHIFLSVHLLSRTPNPCYAKNKSFIFGDIYSKA